MNDISGIAVGTIIAVAVVLYISYRCGLRRNPAVAPAPIKEAPAPEIKIVKEPEIPQEPEIPRPQVRWDDIDLSDIMTVEEQSSINQLMYDRNWYGLLRLAHVTYSCASDPIEVMTVPELIRFLKQCNLISEKLLNTSVVTALFSNVNVRERNAQLKNGKKLEDDPDKKFEYKEFVVFCVIAACVELFKKQREEKKMNAVDAVKAIFEKYIVPGCTNDSLPDNQHFKKTIMESPEMQKVTEVYNKILKSRFKNYAGANLKNDERDASSCDLKVIFVEWLKCRFAAAGAVA